MYTNKVHYTLPPNTSNLIRSGSMPVIWEQYVFSSFTVVRFKSSILLNSIGNLFTCHFISINADMSQWRKKKKKWFYACGSSRIFNRSLCQLLLSLMKDGSLCKIRSIHYFQKVTSFQDVVFCIFCIINFRICDITFRKNCTSIIME